MFTVNEKKKTNPYLIWSKSPYKNVTGTSRLFRIITMQTDTSRILFLTLHQSETAPWAIVFCLS